MKRTTQSSSHDNHRYQSDHIPQDLTLEILLRLPAKSVVRFRSVSKVWSAITTSQDFINSFETRSLASRPSFLLAVRKGDILLLFSLHKNSLDGPLSCVGSYQSANLKFRHSYYVHGLIFVECPNELVIWNPTVKRSFTLHAPEGNRGCVVGYDSIEGKHIVLRVLRDFTVGIVTYGTQGQRSCKIIRKDVPWHRVTLCNGGCINGVMYYVADVGFINIIMSFNVRSEKFNQIKYPDQVNSILGCHMVPYEGRLAIVNAMNFPCIDLWILKNGDRHEWTHQRFDVPLSDMDPIPNQKLRFNGVSDAGELIFAPYSFSKSFYILCFNLRRNSIREVSFEGTMGDDEFRSIYGFRKDYRYYVDVYPNHFESLVSL